RPRADRVRGRAGVPRGAGPGRDEPAGRAAACRAARVPRPGLRAVLRQGPSPARMVFGHLRKPRPRCPALPPPPQVVLPCLMGNLDTLAVHGGERRPGPEGSVVFPIYQGTVYSVEPGTGYHDIRYIRLNSTPTQVYLHDKLAALEGAEAAVATASGMSAIT